MAINYERCNNIGGSIKHIDWSHCHDQTGMYDRCLCGYTTRPCDGNCGLEDTTWLPWNPDALRAPAWWKEKNNVHD